MVNIFICIYSCIFLDFSLGLSDIKKLFDDNTWLVLLDELLLLAIFLFVLYKWRISYVNRQKKDLLNLVKESESELTNKNEEIKAQKEEILRQQDRVKEVFDELTESIKTAQRIQESFLPPDDKIKEVLPDSFVLYLPKDIVSGDFYWLHVKYDKIYIAAVDCTGHGVAGAFMSIIGSNLLKQIVIENPTYNASEILHQLSLELIHTLNQNSDSAVTKDGMDMSLCIIDPDENLIHFAGANNPLYIIKNSGELTQIAGDKRCIGFQKGNKPMQFTNHVIEIGAGDKFYMFSDGFAAQFGGINGAEKLKYTRFRDFLLSTSSLNFTQQKISLFKKLKEWQGTSEQTDDIMLIGFTVPMKEENDW